MMIFLKFSAINYNINNRWNSNIYVLISMFLFALIFGMRYYVGIDYHAYLDIYELADYRMQYYENGFYLITDLCQKLNLHYSIYFGILAFIQILFTFMAFRNQREILPYLIMVLILSGVVMEGWMNGIRQYIAICIFIYSSTFILGNNKYNLLYYYLLILLATTIHNTAWILVVVPVIFKYICFIYSNIKIQLILYCLCFILQFFSIKFLLLAPMEYVGKLLGYEDYFYSISSNTDVSLGLTNILSFIFHLYIIIYSVRIRKFYNNKLFEMVYCFAFWGILFDYIFGGSMMLLRISLYLKSFVYPLYAFYLYYFFKHRKISWYKIRYVLFVSYFLLLFFRCMVNMSTNTTQYVFYFQNELHGMKQNQRNMLIRNVN